MSQNGLWVFVVQDYRPGKTLVLLYRHANLWIAGLYRYADQLKNLFFLDWLSEAVLGGLLRAVHQLS